MMESNVSCGVTTLLCCSDQCCWGCIHSPTSTVLVSKLKVMIRLFSTFSNNMGLLQYQVGDQNMGDSSGHHLLSLHRTGWCCFVTNKTIKIFLSQNKFIETSNIQKPVEYSRQTSRIFNRSTDIFRVKNA